MATFTHYLQGTSDTTIAATDTLQFAAGTFDSKITVDNYQDSTHVETDASADKSSGNTPNNVKYISSTQADIGAGTVDLSTLNDSDATLKINFSDASSVQTESAIFYAYDGTTTTNAPVGMTVQAAEIGDSSWTNAEGSASAVALADHTTGATSHDFFIAISAKPDSVGEKTGAYRIELTYF